MLSRFFIDRPIFATVLSVVIALVGGIALVSLPIAQYPRIAPPGVNVSISYPGANAQVVAATVAAPIEQQVNGVPGILYLSSQSGNDGSYSLSCTFDVSTDLNAALVMVQNRVTLAMPLLPSPVQKQGITIRKKTPDILMMANFFSPDGRYDDLYLSNFALIHLRDELLRVDGVSDVNIMGERDYSIRVWLDPQQLASRGLSASDVAKAVTTQNLEPALGQLGQPPMHPGQALQMPLYTLGQLDDVFQFGAIVVKKTISNPVSPASVKTATSQATDTAGLAGTGSGTTDLAPSDLAAGGATVNATKISAISTTGTGSGPMLSAPLVYLRDVARVEMGAANYNQACFFDGQPSVGLSVYQLPGTNALDVADRVREKLKELSQRFPEGIQYTIGYDTTPFIRESIDEVFKTLLIAVGLVAIVVLLFLQDWKAMILPMIDVPVSLLGTFAVMAALGYSLNNISLFGLVLAIGIVVDDAIVVLENIERQMAKGLDARTATIKAMEEITGPIIGITLVLCAVFIPCAFLSGITGRFFQQFAVTIAASTMISAINALTMTPSRALLIFRGKDRGGETGRRGEGEKGRQGEGEIGGDSPTPHFPVSPSPTLPKSGHEHKREALPWWIFGVLGGLLTVWLGSLLAEHFDLPAPVGAEGEIDRPSWLAWAWTAAWFAPGLLLGLVLGWFVIGPVNAALGWFFRVFNSGFDKMTESYGWSIGGTLRHSALVLIGYGGLLVLTYWLFQIAPTGFVPQQDMGRCVAGIQLPDSASLERTKEVVTQVEKICRETPGVAHTIAICGTSFLQQANGPNFGSLFIVLKPFEERQTPDLKDEAIMDQLRQRWASEVKDAKVAVNGAAPVPGISVAGGFKMIVEDPTGLDPKNLQTNTERLMSKLKEEPALKGKLKGDVSTPFRSNIPQLYMDIDWKKVAALGLSPDEVTQTLQTYLGSSYVSSFSKFGRTWHVTLQAEGKFRSQVTGLNLFEIRNKWDQMVSLGTLVDVREITGPIFINRYNLYTAAPISGGLLPGASTGEVISVVDQVANDTLPRSMKSDWTELMFLQILEGKNTPPAVVFALVVLFVFLTLAALYESWTLPLAVILVVPLCALCAIIGVLLTGNTVNIFVQIGLVVLVGLACKNAILVVEFAREKHRKGQPILPATQEAAQLRLRPILMTSFAFILGVVPLALASGAGAEMRRSLGVGVFSGMLGVTLFGIFLTPVFFYVIQGFGETKLLTSPLVRSVVSCAAGLFLGLAGGYLLGRLDIVPILWAVPLGGVAGLLGVLAIVGAHKRLRMRSRGILR